MSVAEHGLGLFLLEHGQQTEVASFPPPLLFFWRIDFDWPLQTDYWHNCIFFFGVGARCGSRLSGEGFASLINVRLPCALNDQWTNDYMQ